MKTILRIYFSVLLMGCSSCLALEQGVPRTLNVKVVGEDGKAIEGAEAKIGFSFVGSTRGLTDSEGEISHFGRQKGSWFVGVDKSHYYHTGGLGPMAAPPDPVVITLKRKVNPVAMVVGEVPGGFLPALEEPVGYDLEKADWLPPYGRGERKDLVFEGTMEKREGKDLEYPSAWRAEVTVRFPNPDDGLILYEGVVPIERNTPESDLISLQKAPERGYERKELVQTAQQHPNGNRIESFDWNTQYAVFRVRTEKDENGRILYAHYGKIYKPMYAGPLFPKDSVWIRSLFYFNPTPNDRSLEFNRENLHPDPPNGNLPY